jgi:hypothetical protein
MRGHAKCFDRLRAELELMPLVDCHDHTAACDVRHTDPIMALMNGYILSDLYSASSCRDVTFIQDTAVPLADRWPVFERAWNRTCHTGYAQVVRRVMKHVYKEDDMTLPALQRMQERLPDYTNQALFDSVLEDANIAVRLLDIQPDRKTIVDGTFTLPPRGRLMISLPAFHNVRDACTLQGLCGHMPHAVTNLDEYLEACRRWFQICKDFGAVGFKDQSAYSRSLEYGNPTRAEAEAVFNRFMADPRVTISYPDGVRPLDDYLFHAFMRMARDMDLPVQIHTGHMAGIRNDIVKTNAVKLTSLIELHCETRFDLFHANWPYGGELCFLAKNYPNVAIDFCWANIIDPVYCQQLFQQIISSVPHGKVHGYGSDLGGSVDAAWAHAAIARDNIAIALSNLVEMDYMGYDEAVAVARGWLFDNANTFFNLGLSAT